MAARSRPLLEKPAVEEKLGDPGVARMHLGGLHRKVRHPHERLHHELPRRTCGDDVEVRRVELKSAVGCEGEVFAPPRQRFPRRIGDACPAAGIIGVSDFAPEQLEHRTARKRAGGCGQPRLDAIRRRLELGFDSQHLLPDAAHVVSDVMIRVTLKISRERADPPPRGQLRRRHEKNEDEEGKSEGPPVSSWIDAHRNARCVSACE